MEILETCNLICIKLILDGVYVLCVYVFIFRLFVNPVIMCLVHCMTFCTKEHPVTLNVKCLCALVFLDTLSAQSRAGFMHCRMC